MARMYNEQRVLGVMADTFHAKFRDPFETWPNDNWDTDRQASGDIILPEGNAGAASYLTVSLNPLAAGTETWIESADLYGMPVEFAVGAHVSQKTLGQEFAIEIVSDEDPSATPADLAISSISQTTTTLSVTTALAHNLHAGDRIGINGVALPCMYRGSALCAC